MTEILFLVECNNSKDCDGANEKVSMNIFVITVPVYVPVVELDIFI